MADVEVTMTMEEKVRLRVTPGPTPAGHPGQIDGAVQFTVTAGDCTIEPAMMDDGVTVDPLACWVVSGPTAGDSAVLAEADADMGAGVVNIMATALVHVNHPMAASLGMTAEAPVLK